MSAKTTFKLRVLGPGLKPDREDEFPVSGHLDGAVAFRLIEAIADALCNPSMVEINITREES